MQVCAHIAISQYFIPDFGIKEGMVLPVHYQ